MAGLNTRLMSQKVINNNLPLLLFQILKKKINENNFFPAPSATSSDPRNSSYSCKGLNPRDPQLRCRKRRQRLRNVERGDWRTCC